MPPVKSQLDDLFEYEPGEPYGLNASSQLSQTTVMATMRGAEQGNKGARLPCARLYAAHSSSKMVDALM
jgi:hypothetical protein